ncbi:MAG TPA: tetratricopeptide repeat protein [Caldithrix sp.]|nr:tetratricopeptide repeat protein [Caldithrix sp.]
MNLTIKVITLLIFFISVQNCYLSKPVPIEERSRDQSALQAYSEAVILNDQGQYSKALEKINKAIEMNNKIARFLLLKAQIQENRGHYVDALATYKQVLKIQIYNPTVHEKMGEIFAKIEQYYNAIQSVKKAFAQKPQDTRLLIIIAEYYISLDSYDRAENELKTYEIQIPANAYAADYYAAKAKVFFHSGQYAEAANFLENCRLSKPLTPELHRLYLNALLNSDNYDGLYKHLISLESKDLASGDQHFYRGVYYYSKKNYSDALSQLEFALEFNTNDSRVYYYLGKVHLELGNLNKSKEMFDIFRTKTKMPELEDVELKDIKDTGI